MFSKQDVAEYERKCREAGIWTRAKRKFVEIAERRGGGKLSVDEELTIWTQASLAVNPDDPAQRTKAKIGRRPAIVEPPPPPPSPAEPSGGAEPEELPRGLPVRAINWVADMLGRDREPAQGEAPDSHAWSMYCWARSSESAKREFWTGMYRMLVPSDKQLAEAARRLGEDRDIVKALDRCLAVARRTGVAT